jgi:ATP-dependent Clp protease ATP-binding subunit ClpA
VFDRYSVLARQAIFLARKEAGQTAATSIDTEHLLIGILTVHPELIRQLVVGIDSTSVRDRFRQSQDSTPGIPDDVDLPITPDLGQVLEHAVSIADEQHCREIRTEHLVASMLDVGGHAAEILADSQLEKKTMSNLISAIDCSMQQQPTETSLRAISEIVRKDLFRGRVTEMGSLEAGPVSGNQDHGREE